VLKRTRRRFSRGEFFAGILRTKGKKEEAKRQKKNSEGGKVTLKISEPGETQTRKKERKGKGNRGNTDLSEVGEP